MMTVGTYVAPSRIHGLGVFAKERIPKRTLMWTLVRNFDLEIDPSALPPQAQAYIARYGNKVRPGISLLCGDDARFMNHSEIPNMTGSTDDNYAIRDIQAGEEITCNYRDFDVEFIPFHKRECGTA